MGKCVGCGNTLNPGADHLCHDCFIRLLSKQIGISFSEVSDTSIGAARIPSEQEISISKEWFLPETVVDSEEAVPEPGQ